MRFDLSARVVVLVALAVLVGFAPITAAQDAQVDTDDADAVSPGDRVTGVIQVQQVELENSVERTEFTSRFEALESDEDRATLVASRLDAAQRRTQELQESVENGRRSELAGVAAKIRHLREIANESRELSERLPSDLVEEKAIPRKIESLNDRLDTLENEDIEESLRAVEGEREGADSELPEMDREFLTGLYDSGFDDVPGVAKRVFGNERMNVHVEMVDGETKQFYLETEGGEVVASEVGERDDATLRVETHENVLRRISRSEETSSEFVSALRGDEIEYQGLGALGWLKYGVVGAAQFLVESVGTFLSRVWVF